jgi:hypothetical protein
VHISFADFFLSAENEKMGKISLTPNIATIQMKIKFDQQYYASFSEFQPNRPEKM